MIDKKVTPSALSNCPPQTCSTVILPGFIDLLTTSANNGNLKSKAELIKWHCLYQQEPKRLCAIQDKVGTNPINEEKANCQLQFLHGLAALRSEKYEKAVSIFTELLNQHEKEMRYIRLGTLGLKVKYLLANCYMSRAEFSKAEKILKELQEILAVAKKSRESQAAQKKSPAQPKSQMESEETIQRVRESTDAEPDARIEIDLGYCYMQRGAYEEALEIYKNLYGDGVSPAQPRFMLDNVKQLRRIMGLNNYASCCIFSINDDKNKKAAKEIAIENIEKIEIARRIFNYMDNYFSQQNDEENSVWYEWNPETNLLKGYYTLCTGTKPGQSEFTEKEYNICQDISNAKNPNLRSHALLNAFPYFRKACRFEEAFPSRYELLDENGRGNKAKYRNEIERISVYIISLTKLQKLYRGNRNHIEELITELKKPKEQQAVTDLSVNGFTLTKEQLNYLATSTRALERFLLSLPTNYKISLKAAIALAEWLLDSDEEISSVC